MWIKRPGAMSAVMIGMAACATAPRTDSQSRSLEARADAALSSMKSRDPGLPNLLDSVYGYAVFPEIGKSNADLGADQPGGEIGSVAAYGRGVVFEQGRVSGYIDLNQDSVGAQLGGQTFAELVVFQDRSAMDPLKAGRFELGANAFAIAVAPGAADATSFADDGFAVFTMPQGGLVAELPVSGQTLNYHPGG